MSQASTSSSKARRAAAVAIFGQHSSVGGFRLLGSGAVIGERYILTARHVVDDRPDTRFKIRVFSQAGGIATLEPERRVAFRHPVRGAGIVNDIALLRLRSPIEGVEPAPIAPAASVPKGAQCLIPGFGGRRRGLFEERRVERLDINKPDRDQLIRFALGPEQSLRATDSGSPVFYRDKVVAVYFGRDDKRRPVGAPLDEELVTSLEESGANARESSRERFEEVVSTSEEALLGIGETNEHPLEWEGEPADLGVVALNGASLGAGAPEEDVRFRVELFEPDDVSRSRDFESQFQTFWRRRDGGVEPGSYRLKVTATASAAVYQLNWTIYRRA